ncbi:unnamed protein product [Agarophyton chilense]
MQPHSAFVLQPFMSDVRSHNGGAQKKIFVFGLGYAGIRIAHQLRKSGASIAGITQSTVSSSSNHQDSMVVQSCEGTSKSLITAFVGYHLKNSTHVLSTVAPDMFRSEDPILAQYADLLLKSDTIRWFGYLSSTSVYGDHSGALVDELSSSLNPSAKGKLRLAVESSWIDLAKRAQVLACVFRVAGIYGPSRNALQTLLRNPSVMNQTSDTLDMIVSRIHVVDLANAVTSAVYLEHPESEARSFSQVYYNIGDDLPASRRAVFGYAAALLQGTKFPRHTTDSRVAAVSTRHSIRASKQVSNAKMKNLLLPNLSFPTYREGLGAIAQELEISKRPLY